MKSLTLKYPLLFLILLVALTGAQQAALAQGFLHVDGKRIVDANNENFILRGIGTGNWLLQEGYMMQTAGLAGTQTQFRNKLIETIGEERTNQFYDSWIKNHFRKIDVDSMAAWGFNSVRVAMHYKWLTLPIEEEPVPGENTWLEEGFQVLDSLLQWCGENQMYLILDMHAAPGGQGKNADISDYDETKPSLWESELNKSKTVALWKKLAERYANEPWMGGYDLINEVNWSFDEGNNQPLLNLYKRITNAIREVDNNHILFIEGNWFANDFSGLTEPWDDNMVYSFHKYWSYNNADALKWVTDLRENSNRPIWLGESGENSNVWFTNLVGLCESQNIGWSWWPVKKTNINNVLQVTTNKDYLALVDMWKGNGSMSADAAFNAVMTFSENHRFENCKIKYDVIDALIRQPHTTKTLPFKAHKTQQKIFAVDYDLGRNAYAYFDVDTANHEYNTQKFGQWNNGWNYRNDGVDIEINTDPDTTCGYHVAWIDNGEWLQYTINSDSIAAYDFVIRTASPNDALIHLEVNGKVASPQITIPKTGTWEAWSNTTIPNIILPEAEAAIKIVFDKGGLNVNYFLLTQPKAISEVAFSCLTIETDPIENRLYINLNKPVTSAFEDIQLSDFQLIVNHSQVSISELKMVEGNPQQIQLFTNQDLFSTDEIKLSYRGNTIQSGDQYLEKFTAMPVKNNYYHHFEIPGKIQAEDAFKNSGFELEACEDIGGGMNIAYANDGDYLDYLVHVSKAGTYQVNFRVATSDGAPQLLLMNSYEDRMVANKLLKISTTGGWQNWETQSVTAALPEGKMIIRLFSRAGEYNLNWFSFDLLTGANDIRSDNSMQVYPVPADESINVRLGSSGKKLLAIFNLQGKKMIEFSTSEKNISLNTDHYPAGVYVLKCMDSESGESVKFQITHY
ncbi:carbohydrate-binding protein [Maribellus sediminis]|uniref:carbohydrate-binding protein n=1 Tax=Maribellus sediminis TaxID=2696285 RepID=UPI0014301F97|nr:carbohydrate-binding protein [Maribellus sediminis]